VWNSTQIVEERAADGSKQKRWTGGVEFLDSSNQQTGKRLLTTDHLGSSRAVVDGTNGTITASYAFSPWGKRSRIAGTEDVSNGYTGHLWHESGLSLAVYRPYNPETGRWPSRDPLGEPAFETVREFTRGLEIPETLTSQHDKNENSKPNEDKEYVFTENNSINNSDYNGLDITLETGNNSGKVLNDVVHQNVCGDCNGQKTCFSFAAIGARAPWASSTWLGWSSWVGPSPLMGHIYSPSPVPGAAIASRHTSTPAQTKKWIRYVTTRLGMQDTYSVANHNCRKYAQWEFRDAPLHW
jgi:RHS repeat-associated protein